MIGGLVEHQQIGSLQQDACQSGSRFFASRKNVDLCVELVRCKSYADEGGSNAGIDLISARSLELVQQIVVSMSGFRVVLTVGDCVLQLSQLSLHLVKPSERVIHSFFQCSLGLQTNGLRQVSGSHITDQPHGAFGRWFQVGDDLEQRRFTDPVVSDQRNAITR